MHGHGLKRNAGFTEFLLEIVESGQLKDAALGITEQVIAEGKSSLSAAKASLSKSQRWTFTNYVENVYVKENCQNGCPIPWPEMFAAHKNGGWCGKCSSSKPKNDQPIS